ncbi:TetR/AcrR family transcriptional regulator [Actinophytocola xanthii]|uniref:TetR family transcriptional regulator n=1 Tax=Actinophytocola xanthii TaxID=1912961 RepID=A0A1Q8CPT9_9PSEU|nr:TetR/AcrR family transcriptional regulator [Actinophytocola xanthii]OLF16359.1 TetR family transcriptional regulator [Actinophytocola xanthii]
MTTTPKASRAALARDRLLRAATDELAETGELEVAAVARRAGVSVGLPYRYFATRSGLLIAVLDAFYERLGQAAALRVYDAATWADRERRRVRDWVTALYAEPLAPLVLGGLVGDAEVAAANTRHLHLLIELGARNIAQAQRAGELPDDRDPELLAAATLGGTNTMLSVALSRTPRPSAEKVITELWTAVRGTVGLPS